MSGLDELPVVVWAQAGPEDRRRVLNRGSGDGAGSVDQDLRERVVSLVEDVRARGDEALLDALRRFDGIELTADRLRVSDDEFDRAGEEVGGPLREAIRLSIARVREFNERIRERSSWSVEIGDAVVGEAAAPIDAVGLYVPSGKGSFPSVLIHIATPAVVAGVPRIAVLVPPLPDGRVDPAILVVAAELGLREVYRANGPTGIAALALGTATLPRVRKIVGPGSPAVTYTQMEVQRYGCVVEVGIGPTDSLIVADASADPRLLAADLLNEAEHGPDSSAVLVCLDRDTLDRAAVEVTRQLAALPEPRREYATTSIRDNGGLVLAADRAEAMAIANDYAPEHLQLAVADPDAWLSDVRYAGTALLGQWTTFSASNFAIGTPATLPTTGFAKAVSGITAHTYLTRTAVAKLREPEFWRIAPAITGLAEHEGFPAHAASVAVRRTGAESEG